MGKRYDEEDGSYRIRRGKKVKIPDEWAGHVVHDQTRRKRRSQQSHYQRDSEESHRMKDGSHDWSNYRQRRYEPLLDE